MGSAFLRPACLDWEHKHFFAGDLGELTGEMGTVATFRGSEALFDATLGPLEDRLQEAGHVGWVNLNMIVNEDGVWPLEFTCRFGYPGFAVLEPLQATGWADLFASMLRGGTELPTNDGFSLCVVLSTPPFPLARYEVDAPVGLPVIAQDIEDEASALGRGRPCRRRNWSLRASTAGQRSSPEQARPSKAPRRRLMPRSPGADAEPALSARHRRQAHRRSSFSS